MKKTAKGAAIILALACFGFVGYFMLFPDVSKLVRENPKRTAFMVYREKEWASAGRRMKVDNRWVSLAKVSPFLIKAVLIAEDDKYWKHSGFDYEAIRKALERDVKEGKLKFGGSTVSQQLVKNLYLSPDKNPLRKIGEAIITWRLERTVSKKRILEVYLNIVEWGDGVFGAEAASRRYFGKPSSELIPREAAILAAVLPNPLRFRADSPSPYIERRAKAITEIMVRRGIIAPEYEDIVGGEGWWDENGARQPKPPVEEGRPREGPSERFETRDYR